MSVRPPRWLSGCSEEEYYRHLFKNAQEGIVITTPDEEFLDANPTAEQIYGYSRDELRSMGTRDLYADPAEREDVIRELEKTGTLRGREIRIHRGDGQEIVCEMWTTSTRALNGNAEVYVSYFHDVTQRKKAEKALKESEETFRKLAENALVGISLIHDGTCEYANPALAEITGYPRETLLDASPKRVVHPDDWPSVRKQMQKRIEGEVENVHFEARVQRKDGEIRHVKVAGSRILYQGRPAAIATIRDVTRQKHLQREILQVQREERKRIGEDLHDGVASQLVSIRLKLDLLAKRLENARDEEKSCEVDATIDNVTSGIREVEEQLVACLDDLRQLSRGLSPTGLSNEGILEALRQLADTSAEISLTVDENSETDSLLSDLSSEKKTQVYWIIQEAIVNARRHADASEIEIRITTETDGNLTFAVRDDGVGFNHSDIGTEGLGLRSMRNRGELIGAELTVDTEPGSGTCVQVHIPT